MPLDYPLPLLITRTVAGASVCKQNSQTTLNISVLCYNVCKCNNESGTTPCIASGQT